jgi:hypothetical protein
MIETSLGVKDGLTIREGHEFDDLFASTIDRWFKVRSDQRSIGKNIPEKDPTVVVSVVNNILGFWYNETARANEKSQVSLYVRTISDRGKIIMIITAQLAVYNLPSYLVKL